MRKKVLSPRQLKFIEDYLQHGNATRAAIAAGYSKRSPESIGHKLLRNDKIRTEIEYSRKAAADRFRVTSEETLRLVAARARANIGDFVRWTGDSFEVIPSEQLSTEQRSAVESIRFSRNDSGELQVAIKMRDNWPAIAQLVEIHQLATASETTNASDLREALESLDKEEENERKARS